ncbi:MAG: putative sugar nucleotidyl transferase [candidate division WOR-3 bacterium]
MIYLYEDNDYKNFLPLVYFRPGFELYCGCVTFKDKLKYFYPNEELGFLVRPLLVDLLREKYPNNLINQFSNQTKLSLFISARAVLKEKIILEDKEELFFNQNNELIGFCLRPERIKKFPINEEFIAKLPIPKRQIKALKINYLWDLIEHNSTELKSDFLNLTSLRGIGDSNSVHHHNIQGKLSPQAIIIGELKNLYVGIDAEVEADVVLDLRAGPVYIDDGAQIRSFSKLVGPVYIGKDSVIDCGYLHSGVTVGPNSRISGEVCASVFQGYINKQHYGYIGHAYIGEWVNLGAGTTNSDLKNNYSTVKVQLSGKKIDTKLLKVGTFIGDHTKTAIGTLIGTGTIIGVFCNVTEHNLKTKYLKNFYWSKAARWQLNKAITTAQVMMARRGVIMSQAYKELIAKIYRLKSN